MSPPPASFWLSWLVYLSQAIWLVAALAGAAFSWSAWKFKRSAQAYEKLAHKLFAVVQEAEARVSAKEAALNAIGVMVKEIRSSPDQDHPLSETPPIRH